MDPPTSAEEPLTAGHARGRAEEKPGAVFSREGGTQVSEEYDRRIGRAGDLAEAHPSAREILLFYRKIAEFQKSARARMAPVRGLHEGPDVDLLLPLVPPLLALIATWGPALLAEQSRELSAASPASWRAMLDTYWQEGAAGPAIFAHALLGLYAECLAAQGDLSPPAGENAICRCPRCHRLPIVGVLREQDYGARRSMICSLCSTEWSLARLLCPFCREDAAEKLSVYTAETFPHIRVEACHTCRAYLKTVNLTVNGLAVPLVDEIAALTLDLWAQEQGYSKPARNLLGM